MATYKVPQDVEAEDKLLGPLTFKQFIFMLIAGGGGLLAWLMWQVHPFLVVLPLPIVVIFGGLAVFRREDQPMERYLLSFFNFLLRPRQRVWNTEGYYEHLVLTKPKKQEETPLKQDVHEVHGQLEKLAQTVDTRGWAAKRPELTVPDANPAIGASGDDRLFRPDESQDPAEVHEREDIMSEENPEGMQLDNLLHEQTRKRREQVMENVRRQARGQTPAEGETVPQASEQPTPAEVPAAAPAAEASESPPSQPAGRTGNDQAPDNQAPQNSTPETAQQSGILNVSDELSVSQIAAAANRQSDDRLQEGEEIQLR